MKDTGRMRVLCTDNCYSKQWLFVDSEMSRSDYTHAQADLDSSHMLWKHIFIQLVSNILENFAIPYEKS